MSLTLAFDTATADTTVAVCDGAEPVVERAVGPEPGGRPRHGSALLALVEELVGEAGGWERIGLIAVGTGPGSFTGIRIGVATARALGQARELPIAGVPSTASLAAGIPDRADRPRLAVIDARRGEAFAAVLAPGEILAGEPQVLDPSALGELAQGLGSAVSPLAAGDGAIRFRSDLEAAGVEVLADEDPAHRLSARLVAALAPAYGPGDAVGVEPLYLRRPDAERWRERSRGDR